MSDVPREAPEWVQRMRAAGYGVRTGTIDEPLSEIPDAMFPPPVSVWRRRFGGNVISGIRTLLFRANTATRNGRHAPLP